MPLHEHAWNAHAELRPTFTQPTTEGLSHDYGVNKIGLHDAGRLTTATSSCYPIGGMRPSLLPPSRSTPNLYVHDELH